MYMREHKIRIWDADNNEMLGPFDLTQNPIYWADKMRDGVLIQYTGLKDANGVEIFEGDILQTDYYPCSVEDDYVLVVEYDIDRFWCVRKLKANANARGVSDGIADGLYEFLDHGLKVIGNIYENKELLEEK